MPGNETMLNTTLAGTFRIGGEIEVNRLGFGAMGITGPGVWGEPNDREEAIRTLKNLPEFGVNLVDTADSYGPDISEELIREALHPYGNILVATKAGLVRTGPDQWTLLGHPEYLIQQAYKSLRRLGIEQIDLWHLHRIDPNTPQDEQFDAVRHLIGKGVIRHAGLSEVSVEDIKNASRFFKVATVQNRYHLGNRNSEDVLDYCTKNGIGFIPWSPLAAGNLTGPGSVLETIARQHSATPGQIALAWLLRCSPVMLPIPGTSKVAHLKENVGAAQIILTDEEFATLDRIGKKHG